MLLCMERYALLLSAKEFTICSLKVAEKRRYVHFHHKDLIESHKLIKKKSLVKKGKIKRNKKWKDCVKGKREIAVSFNIT